MNYIALILIKNQLFYREVSHTKSIIIANLIKVLSTLILTYTSLYRNVFILYLKVEKSLLT